MKSLAMMIGMTAAVAASGATAAERSVKMKDLPAAVQQTVLEKTKGLTLVGLSEETEKGQTFYEAETKVDGKTRDILIDATGAVVEEEQEVPLDSIPEAARAAIERAAGNAKVELVESVTKGGTTVYEATVKKNGKKTEIVVASDGTIQEKH